MVWVPLLTLSSAALGAGTLGQPIPPGIAVYKAFSCGYHSLMALAEMEAVPIASSAAVDLVARYGKQDEMSMLDLKTAAHSIGLAAEVYRASVEELHDLERPAVVHLESGESGEGHFALLLDFNSDGAARLLEWGSLFVLMDAADFSHLYSGACLASTADLRGAPALSWDTVHIDLGELKVDRRNVSCVFTARNVSDKAVSVAVGKTTSECDVSLDPPKVVDPGGLLRVELSGSALARSEVDGTGQHWVEVVSSDPEKPVEVLSLRWTEAMQFVVAPNTVSLLVAPGSRGPRASVAAIAPAPFHITGYSIEGPFEVVQATPTGGPTLSLSLDVTAEATGAVDGVLRIESDFEREPAVEVALHAEVLSLVYYPRRLVTRAGGTSVIHIQPGIVCAAPAGFEVVPQVDRLHVTADVDPGSYELVLSAGDQKSVLPVKVTGG